MRTPTKALGALAIAALVVTGGTAFTATSTIDEANKTVGATGQTISGVDVTSVSYTWNPSTDETSGVDFVIGSPLGANDTLTVELNGNPGVCIVTVTDVACTWASPVVNATSLSIVVN